MPKLPFYIPELFPRMLIGPWFGPLSPNFLFKEKLPSNFFETDVERVGIEKARAVVLPNNFKVMTSEAGEYIKQYLTQAEEFHLPLYCFSLGDFTDKIHFDPRIHVFRYSVYRSTISPQDIVMPPAIEDHGQQGIAIRKKEAKPTISFCGMAALPTERRWVTYFFKTLFYKIASLVQPSLEARILGIYWRRKAIRACAHSSLVTTNFIIRNFFSADLRTIERDPVLARKEYIENIINSDFVLAPKGDGNFSFRFFEALSLGRIPVLIDTDCVLPLEDVIDYSKIIVRVPMNRVADLPRYIREFYDRLSDEEWASRQQRARQVFEDYLRQDSYFRYFFTHFL
jgi:hypothetical protein